jgi:hypothetical protein
LLRVNENALISYYVSACYLFGVTFTLFIICGDAYVLAFIFYFHTCFFIEQDDAFYVYINAQYLL